MSAIPTDLRGIVVAKSAISYLDGQRGVFCLSGYDVRDLVGRVSFEDVAHLLWHRRFPQREERPTFLADWSRHRELPGGVVSFLKSVPTDALPIYVLRSAMSVLGMLTYARHPPETPEEAAWTVRTLASSIAAKTGMIVATFKRLREGKAVPPLRPELTEASHLLYMLTGDEPSETAAQALDTYLTLQCDHGLSNSTFSCRVVGSSLTDVYSAITAAIGALNGPLHGGENAHVLPMLQEIGEPELAEAWVLKRLAHGRTIMGTGHNVYQAVDPRTAILKEAALKIDRETKLVEIAERVEEITLREKGLRANVHLYAAPLFDTLGIPPDLFTPLFVISRTAGWLAHLMEQLSDNKVFRPDCEYLGPPPGRKFIQTAD